MLLDERTRDHWLAVLAPFHTLYVGVHCSLDELERRERGRTNRLGLSRWSFHRVHAGVEYDLVVDTTTATPLECAQRIRDVVALRSDE